VYILPTASIPIHKQEAPEQRMPNISVIQQDKVEESPTNFLNIPTPNKLNPIPLCRLMDHLTNHHDHRQTLHHPLLKHLALPLDDQKDRI
jgi:hypothetical protein